MRIATWNMNHSKAHRQAAWEWLQQRGVDVALVQESLPPPEEFGKPVFRVVGDETKSYSWGSGVVALRPDLVLRPRPRVELAKCYMQVPEDGAVPDSHPGASAIADVLTSDNRLLLTVVSLYAQWEGVSGTSDWYSCSRFHRVVSDLTGILAHANRCPVVLAGDFNLSTQHDTSRSSRIAAQSAAAAFARLKAWQLVDCVGRTRSTRERLAGCQCLDGDACSHVETFRRKGQPTGSDGQLDYVFVSESLADPMSCTVTSDAYVWGLSDHCPLLIDINTGWSDAG